MSRIVDVTVVILTKDEEIHLERAIHSIGGIAKRVVVVDSFSSDRTVEIASSLGAEVLQNAFQSQAQQFEWALSKIDITTAWILRLDADEIIEEDLGAQISESLPSMPSDVVGIRFRRKHIFMGKWIRFGGRYPIVLLRLWRTGFGRVENRLMDEHVEVWGGRTVELAGGFVDCNLNDLSFFTKKHNAYATREAVEVLKTKWGGGDHERLSLRGNSWRTYIKRFMKNKIYNILPFYVSALLYFVWRYFFLFGFLDGQAGVIYHFLQGFWYRFLVGAKVREFEMVAAKFASNEEKLSEISRVTGFRVN